MLVTGTKINSLTGEETEIEIEVIENTPEELQAQINYQLLAYLSSTDWVEPYLLRHELKISILPIDSNKLIIAKKRQEAKDALKLNSYN